MYDVSVKKDTPCFYLGSGVMSHNTIPWQGSLRELIVSRSPTGLMVHFDYSQNEVRVIAMMAGELDLIAAFKNGLDVHRFVASKIWKKKPEDVSTGERRFSKIAVFSILYGKSVYTFAQEFMYGNLEEAQALFDGFYLAFPKLKVWIDEQHRNVHKDGIVRTMYGDPLRIPLGTDRKSKSSAERLSVNYPIQSGSSSMAAVAGWDCVEEIEKIPKMQAIPLCFTHDSHDWDVESAWFIEFLLIVKMVAVDRIEETLGIPAAVDFEVGVCQSGMMEVKDPKFTSKSVSFGFHMQERFYKELITKLEVSFEVEVTDTHRTSETESINELFMTRRAFSSDIGKEVFSLSGNIKLIKKAA